MTAVIPYLSDVVVNIFVKMDKSWTGTAEDNKNNDVDINNNDYEVKQIKTWFTYAVLYQGTNQKTKVNRSTNNSFLIPTKVR